jgi:hypothetical protein
MRVLLFLVLSILPVAAQSPIVQLWNESRPGSGDLQIGDRFKILIFAAPDQPISVRTIRQSQTDWGPIIDSTDYAGRWSTAGQFDKSDFGWWSEIWTVGGKLASPAIQFFVTAPCRPGGHGFVSQSGPNVSLSCETTEGQQTFGTPSPYDPFRTPDGRLVPGRPTQGTARQYHMEIIEHLIASGKNTSVDRISLHSSQGGGLGDETADLISELIGVNALTEDETRNVLQILRAAFEKPETIQPSAKPTGPDGMLTYPSILRLKQPVKTLLLLRHFADLTANESLKQEIADTIAYVQAR